MGIAYSFKSQDSNENIRVLEPMRQLHCCVKAWSTAQEHFAKTERLSLTMMIMTLHGVDAHTTAGLSRPYSGPLGTLLVARLGIFLT